VATAAHAFAGGHGARAVHPGAFVWADAGKDEVVSQRENQFLVQAEGGAHFQVNEDAWLEIHARDDLLLGTSSGAYLSRSGAWNTPSDRALKADFHAVDAQEVLARLAELPISTWHYRADDPAVRHMGPVGQDFHAAFGLGADALHIASLDADGVALAAVQGLYQRALKQEEWILSQRLLLREQDARVQALEAQVAALEAENARIAALETQVAALVDQLSALTEQCAGGGQ
jgi:hypothetical protein